MAAKLMTVLNTSNPGTSMLSTVTAPPAFRSIVSSATPDNSEKVEKLTTNRRLPQKIEGSSRHSYVNLPVTLTYPEKTSTMDSNVAMECAPMSSSTPFDADNGDHDSPQKEAGVSTCIDVNSVFRCPPDGASFFEYSPSCSNVSSVSVATGVQDTRSCHPFPGLSSSSTSGGSKISSMLNDLDIDQTEHAVQTFATKSSLATFQTHSTAMPAGKLLISEASNQRYFVVPTHKPYRPDRAGENASKSSSSCTDSASALFSTTSVNQSTTFSSKREGSSNNPRQDFPISNDRKTVKQCDESIKAMNTVSVCTSANEKLLSAAEPQWIPPSTSCVRHKLPSCPPEGVQLDVTRQGNAVNTQLTARQENSHKANPRPKRLFINTPKELTRKEYPVQDHTPKPSCNVKPLDESVTRVATRRSGTSPASKPFSNMAQSFYPIKHSAHHDDAVSPIEYQPLSPTETEWWIARQRSQFYCFDNPTILTEDQTTAANKQKKDHARSLTSPRHTNLSAIPCGSDISENGRHQRTLVPNKTFDTNRDNDTVCKGDGVTGCSSSSSERHRLMGYSSARQKEHYRRHRLLGNAVSLSSQAERRYHSQMTQSVLSPGVDWPVRTDSTDGTQEPLHDRNRRGKSELIRSHSQKVNTYWPVHEIKDRSTLETSEKMLSSEFYQRSQSETVPSQFDRVEGPGPMVMARWHSSKPLRKYAQEQSKHGFDKKVRQQKNLDTSEARLVGDCCASGMFHHVSAPAIFEQLSSQPWFHSDLPRADAERLLKSCRIGAFLVRCSETNAIEYSLSIRRENDVLHMKISRDPESGYYVLGEYSQPYPSITAMIHRYSRNLLPVRGTTPILLRFPIKCTRHIKSAIS